MLRVRYALVLLFVGVVSLLGAVDRSLVPASIREPLLDGIARETAFRHVEALAANRDRQRRSTRIDSSNRLYIEPASGGVRARTGG